MEDFMQPFSVELVLFKPPRDQNETITRNNNNNEAASYLAGSTIRCEIILTSNNHYWQNNNYGNNNNNNNGSNFFFDETQHCPNEIYLEFEGYERIETYNNNANNEHYLSSACERRYTHEQRDGFLQFYDTYKKTIVKRNVPVITNLDPSDLLVMLLSNQTSGEAQDNNKQQVMRFPVEIPLPRNLPTSMYSCTNGANGSFCEIRYTLTPRLLYPHTHSYHQPADSHVISILQEASSSLSTTTTTNNTTKKMPDKKMKDDFYDHMTLVSLLHLPKKITIKSGLLFSTQNATLSIGLDVIETDDERHYFEGDKLVLSPKSSITALINVQLLDNGDKKNDLIVDGFTVSLVETLQWKENKYVPVMIRGQLLEPRLETYQRQVQRTLATTTVPTATTNVIMAHLTIDNARDSYPHGQLFQVTHELQVIPLLGNAKKRTCLTTTTMEPKFVSVPVHVKRDGNNDDVQNNASNHVTATTTSKPDFIHDTAAKKKYHENYGQNYAIDYNHDDYVALAKAELLLFSNDKEEKNYTDDTTTVALCTATAFADVDAAHIAEVVAVPAAAATAAQVAATAQLQAAITTTSAAAAVCNEDNIAVKATMSFDEFLKRLFSNGNTTSCTSQDKNDLVDVLENKTLLDPLCVAMIQNLTPYQFVQILSLSSSKANDAKYYHHGSMPRLAKYLARIMTNKFTCAHVYYCIRYLPEYIRMDIMKEIAPLASDLRQERTKLEQSLDDMELKHYRAAFYC